MKVLNKSRVPLVKPYEIRSLEPETTNVQFCQQVEVAAEVGGWGRQVGKVVRVGSKNSGM